MWEFRGSHSGDAEELRLIDCFWVSLLTGGPFAQDLEFQQVDLDFRLQLLQMQQAYHASLFGGMLLNYELLLAMNGDKTTILLSWLTQIKEVGHCKCYGLLLESLEALLLA